MKRREHPMLRMLWRMRLRRWWMKLRGKRTVGWRSKTDVAIFDDSVIRLIGTPGYGFNQPPIIIYHKKPGEVPNETP